jgi:hypothetical protein
MDGTAIAKAVGTFKANMTNWAPPADYAVSKPSDLIALKYQYLTSQAKALNVDVVDFTELANRSIPKMNDFLVRDLTSLGVDQKTAKTVANKMQEKQYSLLDQAQKGLYSTYDFAIANINLCNSSEFDLTYIKTNGEVSLSSEEIAQRIENAQLKATLNYVRSSLNNTLTINDNGLFPSKMADYSIDGKTGYTTNSIITETDLSSLFSFKYNPVAGADLSQFDLDDLPATSTGDYSTDVIDALGVVQTLGTYTGGEYDTYELGDVVPSYQLRAKILSYDATTDSHFLNLNLQFGVSRDSDPSNII